MVNGAFLMGVGGSFLPLPSGLITVGGGGWGWCWPANELVRWAPGVILEGDREAALWRVLPLQWPAVAADAPPPLPTWRVVEDDVTNSRLE